VAAPPVAWTLPARQDLLRAIRYLAEQSPAAAEKLLNRLESAAASIAEFPERGRVVPELGLPRRELLIEDYRLVYRVRRGEIEVLRVIHGKQDFLKAWKEGLQP
jgi:plasmid stabilization system protein ParE